MVDVYDPSLFEKKWTALWQKTHLYDTPSTVDRSKKRYILDMFPYPSGAGLHVGHTEGETATDILTRFLRMRGYQVLHPMGWDSFGLPTENFAIKNGVHPHEITEKAIATFITQINNMGFSYDWDRELGAHRPDYYKWTQWLFLFLYKKGLAYRAKAPVNWCPSCQTVLANEQVVDEGVCERCATAVVQKQMEQWFFKITAYAQRLLDDLSKVDWPQSTKLGQKHWIGRSEGINIEYQVINSKNTITCFTTTPVNFGATFIVLAPEHPLVAIITTNDQKKAVERYLNDVQKKSELARTKEADKTGVFTGAYVLNQVTQEPIPVWVADFVIGHVGTGAVQGCPGHDLRDFAFAQKYHLPITRVVVGPDGDMSAILRKEQVIEKGMPGKMINSDFLNGVEFKEAMQKTMDYFEQKGWGKRIVTYKLRDWLISRQRYWGAPIPMIYCEDCAHLAEDGESRRGWQPVPETELPVKLPDDVDFKPTGKSPIAYSKTFQQGVTCPRCHGTKARREVDTMDTFVDSSWYFMRFADPHNDNVFVSKKALATWLPVDVYMGGAEHTVLHLMYARFITKALFDAKLIDFDEPFMRLRHQGTVMGPDHRRMSKRWGNVINPDDEVAKYGADTVRLYEMFMGPLKDTKSWSTDGIRGVHRFLTKVWKLQPKVDESGSFHSEPQRRALHITLAYAQKAIPEFRYNTTVSKYMELVNGISQEDSIDKEVWEGFLTILAPFAPFMAEELWSRLGHTNSIHTQPWPRLEEALIKEDTVTIPIQINGKVRATIRTTHDDEKRVVTQALKEPLVQKYLKGIKSYRTIYVPHKILNFITKISE